MDILSIENIRLDIHSYVDEDFPSSIGFHKGTRSVISASRMERVVSQLPTPSYHAGGRSTDLLKTASGLGLDTGILGYVENGDTGRFLRNDLSEKGVRTYCTLNDQPHDVRIVLRGTDGTRTVIDTRTVPGTVPAAGPNDGILAGTKILFLSPDRRLPAARLREYARRASENGVKVVIEIPVTELIFTERDEILSLVWEYADLVITCDEAAAILTRTSERPSPYDMARFLETTVVQTGAGGAAAFDAVKGSHLLVETEGGVDLGNDGSAFSAGFLYGMLSGLRPEACLRVGLSAARELNAAGSVDPAGHTIARIHAEIGKASVAENGNGPFIPADA